MPFPRRPRTAAAVLAALASAGVLATQVLAVPPAADFTVTPGVPDVGDPVAFDSTVTDEDAGDTFSYAWDFDDGNELDRRGPVARLHDFGDQDGDAHRHRRPRRRDHHGHQERARQRASERRVRLRPGDSETERGGDLHVIVERRRGWRDARLGHGQRRCVRRRHRHHRGAHLSHRRKQDGPAARHRRRRRHDCGHPHRAGVQQLPAGGQLHRHAGGPGREPSHSTGLELHRSRRRRHHRWLALGPGQRRALRRALRPQHPALVRDARDQNRRPAGDRLQRRDGRHDA